ncbi:hypothetical protein DERP_003600 [Dermatophagoides pteronyssinus]|uniref:Uncharacterized protein n=1 Tax=Dermatophagoides pteronyssinus TaxID=6956 RepID=A0ABQ8JL27_DERPT|nr:hypothetical protein DERP_003600 [Dermatophagoides pteronyssinus]
MLYGVIPDAEFKIFALFSDIISNLTKPMIKEEVIKKCGQFIDKFMNEFNKLYPTDMQRYNVHVENSMGIIGPKKVEKL